MVGPVNVKKKSTLNVKKKFGQLHDQSDGQFGQFGRPWSVLSAFSGFGVSTFQVKNTGKCHDLQRKCKIKKNCAWIREIVGVLGGK